MNLAYHRMPAHLFDALAAGGGGPDAIRELARAQYSKHILLLRGVLAAAAEAGTEQRRSAWRGYDLLAKVQRREPGAARAVIGHPSVGAWAQRVIRTVGNGRPLPGADPGRMGAVAIAAAIRARMPAEMEVAAADGKVVLPSLGAAMMDGPVATVRCADGQAEVCSPGRRVVLPQDPHVEAPGWLPIRRVCLGRRDLFIDDLDPFRMPALTTLAPRLDAAEADGWVASMREVWPLLERHHPEVAAEVEAAVTVIVPHATPPRGHSSSTTAETFGAVALSAPVDPCTSAASLAHEVQHLKLFALLDIVALTLPGDGRRYYAPWRPDPRPLSGLLQGAYAFLGVTGFWRRQRQLTDGQDPMRAHTEFAKWLMATVRVVQTLQSSGRLTAAGDAFVNGMSRTLNGWQDDPVPAEALAMASDEAEAHLARWERENGGLRLA
jgi:uncharacterized protein